MRTVLPLPELTPTGVINVAPRKATAGSVEKVSRRTLRPTPQFGGSRLRVGIADDHEIVRKGLRDLLSGLTDVEVVGEAADGREVIDLARRVQMDVLLMDLAMPNKTGLDALGSLHTQFPDLSVLIFSGFPEDRYALALRRLGAAGFLGKDTAPEDMIKAIRAVGSGKSYWSADITSLLTVHLCEEHLQPHHALTSREFQIFLRLGRGETVGAVGRSLDLSYKTVSAHRTKLMRKLAFSSNSELTYYAVKHGLLECRCSKSCGTSVLAKPVPSIARGAKTRCAVTREISLGNHERSSGLDSMGGIRTVPVGSLACRVDQRKSQEHWLLGISCEQCCLDGLGRAYVRLCAHRPAGVPRGAQCSRPG